ncbi:hypothetical protein PUN28_012993 [Cardiocondyla obscurior]|uniref:Uncharacterized protein n=1 Tax=Cardiocondyla obscurior TaxID=286306 RepID=A0AAW2FBA1_9HYME
MDSYANQDLDISLIKQFLCCAPLIKMDFTALDYCGFSLDIQKQVLDNTINNDLIKQYPIKTSYQKAFLKLFMQKIEDSDNETSRYITLKENINLISEGTTGLCSWQGALALSKWCAENKEQFYRKNVLELGCGIGLTGMSVIITCSPKQYIFSDCHPMVLDVLCENIKLNFLPNKRCELLRINASERTPKLKLQLKYEQSDVQVMDLKWEDINKRLSEDLSQPDVIIAADILYESSMFDLLISELKCLLTPSNYAIFAATIRNENTISLFLKHLGNYNLAFEECNSPKSTISIQSIDAPVQILKIFQKV